MSVRLCAAWLVALLLASLAAAESASQPEPRYLNRFSLQFGGKTKRQLQDEELQVSSIIGDLLRNSRSDIDIDINY